MRGIHWSKANLGLALALAALLAVRRRRNSGPRSARYRGLGVPCLPLAFILDL